MNILNSREMNLVERLCVYFKRASTRRELLNRGELDLADLGVSRALLGDGVQTWPWREASAPANASGGVGSHTGHLDRAHRNTDQPHGGLPTSAVAA